KNLQELAKRVVAEKALIGVALDGDADRVGIVDEKGRYLSPCQVFPILLEYLIAERGVKGKIVQSVSMGYLAARIAKAHGLEFQELPVGFKHVGEQIALGLAAMGGEESGGYAWKGAGPERDGVLMGLLFLEMCTKLDKTPGELWSEIETKYGKSFFTRVDFHVHKPVTDKALFTQRLAKRLPKKVLGSPIQRTLDIDGLKVILEGDHWVLMRPSGTEPLIRTYAESDSPQRTKDLLAVAQKWVHGH
ncbi:MAG: phosphoglucomutase/phosphomannomutase family protein, partial [Elusimicrobia bacterium]|nr:phosphoglucomutase/phosphomannomutase family protein [Elusimicrobiota bacterium]